MRVCHRYRHRYQPPGIRRTWVPAHYRIIATADHTTGATFLTDTSGENLLEDGNGHGTHVAGTIGSATWGVAKKTKLFAVKVLDSSGSGTTAGVIAGIQYVNDDAQQRSEECPNGIVSNMSLGGRISAPINEAVSNPSARTTTLARCTSY